jgi:hypothetical protein
MAVFVCHMMNSGFPFHTCPDDTQMEPPAIASEVKRL